MFRHRRNAFLLIALLALGGPAAATVCQTDLVPAATLLMPYFETSLVPTGLESIFTVENSSATPVALNAVVWSDFGIPVMGFPIALPAHGSVSVSLHELLAEGKIPESDVSRFPLSQFPGCANLLTQRTIPATLLTQIQNALTGQPGFQGLCYGSSSPGIARGYVTIDTVRDCTVNLPDSLAYFGRNGTGIATNQNVLFGAGYLVDPSVPLSHSEPLVAIEADGSKAELNTTGNYTFYARMVNWTARDNREPLATDFGVRFQLDSPAADFTTDLFVWRDPRYKVTPFACSQSSRILIPDLPQHLAAISDSGIIYPITGSRLRLATQRLKVYSGSGQPGYGIPPDAGNFGWLFFNLNHARPASGATITRQFQRAAQGWVFSVVTSSPYIGSSEAVRFDNACLPNVARKP